MDQILYWVMVVALLSPCVAVIWSYGQMDRARFSHLPPNIINLMVFPWSYRAFWGFSGFLMSGLAFALFAVTLLGDGHIVGAGLSALGAAAIGYACSGTMFRVELEPHGIRYRGLLRHSVFYWEDITAITWSTWSGPTSCFKLKASDGQHIRISVGLTNLSEFARMTLAKVPTTSIDGQSRYWLTESARGCPPSVIGDSDLPYIVYRDRGDDAD